MATRNSIQLHSPGLGIRGSSSLFDGHELRNAVGHLTAGLTPRWTPNHAKAQRSSLYDSFELRAVTNQLNKALKAAHGAPNSLCSSPILKKIYRNKCKKVKWLRGTGKDSTSANNTSVARGILPKIWKMIKKAFH